jgi:hypothetical protein
MQPPDGARAHQRRRCFDQKSPHLDTLGSYREAEVAEAVVTVTDSGHPLYGRRFAVVPAVKSARSDYIHVAHCSGTVLPLPVRATSLHPLPREVGRTKLTLEAIHDLLRLAAEGAHACPSAPARSGQACPPTGAASSSTTLPPCSGR